MTSKKHPPSSADTPTPQVFCGPELILDTIADGVLVVDADGVMLYANRSAEDLLDSGTPLGKLLDIPVAQNQAFKETPIVRRSGPGWAELHSAAVTWEGKPAHVISLRDITAHKQAEKALLEASVRLSHLIATSSTMLFSMRVVGKQLHTDWASDNVGRLLGYSKEEVMHPGWWLKHLHPKDCGRVVAASARLFNGEPVVCDYRFMHKEGREVWIHDEQQLVCDAQGRPVEVVSSWSDITERKEAEGRIHSLAFYDPLTNLPNRRLLLDRLSQALAVSARSRQHGALMLLDLDRFKILNDTHGHDMGDQLLLEVAQRLQANVRESDTVARLGGDEFVVMLGALGEHTNEATAQAQLLAEKIRAALAEPYPLSMPEDKGTVPIVHHSSASIGVVLFMGHEDNVEELMKRADLAMYTAKHARRDAISIFDPAMQLMLNALAALEEHMREALVQQYLLYYQMRVDERGKIVGAEALIRWRHPERGLLLPGEFIPLAEETGLIVPIGKWVLHTACAQIKAWESHPRTRNLKLAVNVSACQFRQADFVDHVRLALEQTGANAERLELEITKSLILHDIEDAIAKMRQLKQIGVRFVMDDLGVDYSSVSTLQRLPLDQLKIDQSVIRDMADDANDAAIVNAILTMGKSLGMEVVAEGVETEVQRDYLVQHGCSNCQGYLFGRPVPLWKFEAQLREEAF